MRKIALALLATMVFATQLKADVTLPESLMLNQHFLKQMSAAVEQARDLPQLKLIYGTGTAGQKLLLVKLMGMTIMPTLPESRIKPLRMFNDVWFLTEVESGRVYSVRKDNSPTQKDYDQFSTRVESLKWLEADSECLFNKSYNNPMVEYFLKNLSQLNGKVLEYTSSSVLIDSALATRSDLSAMTKLDCFVDMKAFN